MIGWVPDEVIDELVTRTQTTQDVRELISVCTEPEYDTLTDIAINALVQSGGRQVVETLVPMLASPKSGQASAAAIVLGRLQAGYAVEALIQALAYPSPSLLEFGDLGFPLGNVRVYAARALGEIGDQRAVEPLINALDDGEVYVVVSAAEALGEIGAVYAITPLVRKLEHIVKPFKSDEEEILHNALLEALHRLGYSPMEQL
ncbi:MAG: HEAT repeat domain-containing protein [Chloroflexota bacterium]|nr:HEAT repeat domain-containing protein [Chloroflexota bacterium]